MSEVIKFVHDWFAEVESTPGRLRQFAFRKGATMRAEIHPVASKPGIAAAVNLRLADGTTALAVPRSCIATAEQQARAA